MGFMASTDLQLIESLFELVRLTVEVALQGPISGVLVAASIVLWTIAFGFFGYLTIGAALSWISGLIPWNIDRSSSQEDR